MEAGCGGGSGGEKIHLGHHRAILSSVFFLLECYRRCVHVWNDCVDEPIRIFAWRIVSIHSALRRSRNRLLDFAFFLWGSLCFAYRSQLLQLQHYVTVVIFLGLFETLTWYFDYRNFNQSGTRPVGPVIVGVLLSSFKRTLSRLLVLIVCMGYGVMKPALSTDQRRKVITLGVVYFGFSSIYDIMSSYSQMTFAMQRARTFFLVPVAALDSIFFLLILQEISTNMQLLRARQQAAKLAVYSRFWYILTLTAGFSVIWVLYQIYTAVNVDEDARWQSLWAFEGAWHITYFIVLIAIAILWRPSSHTLLYAFSEQLSADDDKIEMQSSIRPSSHAMEPAFVADGSDEEK